VPQENRRTALAGAATRREGVDRRSEWRGGRRDTDWTDRPDLPSAPRVLAWWQRLLRQDPNRHEMR